MLLSDSHLPLTERDIQGNTTKKKMAVAQTCVLLHFVYWGATMHIRRSEDNLQKAVLSFYHCGCWGSDSGHQVVNRHLYLLSRLAALAVLLWGLSEAALGGEHVAGPQWPKSLSTPHLLRFPTALSWGPCRGHLGLWETPQIPVADTI